MMDDVGLFALLIRLVSLLGRVCIGSVACGFDLSRFLACLLGQMVRFWSVLARRFAAGWSGCVLRKPGECSKKIAG